MTLKLNGSSSGFTAIDAPAAAGSNTLTLPANNGSNGQFLQTNGSGALSFATVATESNLPAFFASTGNSVQNIPGDGSHTKLTFSEVTDTANAFDDSTDRFTPQTAGYYYFWATVSFQGTNASSAMRLSVFKGGTGGTELGIIYGNTGANYTWDVFSTSGIVSMNGSSDYIEAFVINTPGSGTPQAELRYRLFGAYRLGPN